MKQGGYGLDFMSFISEMKLYVFFSPSAHGLDQFIRDNICWALLLGGLLTLDVLCVSLLQRGRFHLRLWQVEAPHCWTENVRSVSCSFRIAQFNLPLQLLPWASDWYFRGAGRRRQHLRLWEPFRGGGRQQGMGKQGA